MNTQPVLENERAVLYPLQPNDFEALYAVASDPNIWAQHPNKDRWKKDVFQNFFEGALLSKGAFKITDKTSGEIAGSTRFCNYDEKENAIEIGYTFYAVKYWGTGLNSSVKKLMLDYIFQFVSKVEFQIGAQNIRSQIAIVRTGAKKIGEREVAYFGEQPKLNYIYRITKDEYF
jgi:RimJ/RimL family protein N-acetyltransferase